jgi:DNA-binding transcriptional LysR family regulator
MAESLTALKIFLRVARNGSFSKAARELGIPQSSVSRVIAGLERDVNAKLLTRTTRAVVLTEVGAEYFSRLEPILSALEEAKQVLREGAAELRGTLRIAVPAGIAMRAVIPLLPQFMRLHPRLKVDLLMQDKIQNLLWDEVDVAIRIGELAASSDRPRLIGVNHRLLVASPGYLEQHGAPSAPADLAHHSIVIAPPGLTAGAWTFERDGRKLSVRVEGRLTTSLNEGAIKSAVAGAGIASTGEWGCSEELARGELVKVLPEWSMGSEPVHAVFTAGRSGRRAAHAFADFIAAKIAEPAGPLAVIAKPKPLPPVYAPQDASPRLAQT